MGMSILQGGPAPNFMSTNISTYLTGGILLTEDNQNESYRGLCEASLDILQELGYTGIPQRKTLQTAKGLTQ